MNINIDYYRDKSAEKSLHNWLFKESKYAPRCLAEGLAKYHLPVKSGSFRIYSTGFIAFEVVAFFTVKDTSLSIADYDRILRNKINYWFGALVPKKHKIGDTKPTILIFLRK